MQAGTIWKWYESIRHMISYHVQASFKRNFTNTDTDTQSQGLICGSSSKAWLSIMLLLVADWEVCFFPTIKYDAVLQGIPCSITFLNGDKSK